MVETCEIIESTLKLLVGLATILLIRYENQAKYRKAAISENIDIAPVILHMISLDENSSSVPRWYTSYLKKPLHTF